jgi:tRNA wybutosine-synthesizing protein 4
VVLECVLVYMDAPQAAALLASLAASLPTSAVIVYDPTRPDDAFGRQMQLNVAARGCPLRGIGGGATPGAHAARLRAAGWAVAAAADMHDVYRCFLEGPPRAAAERRELLDELEEWTLIQRHYALALGVNDAAVRWRMRMRMRMRPLWLTVLPCVCVCVCCLCVSVRAQGVLGSMSLGSAAQLEGS